MGSVPWEPYSGYHGSFLVSISFLGPIATFVKCRKILSSNIGVYFMNPSMSNKSVCACVFVCVCVCVCVVCVCVCVVRVRVLHSRFCGFAIFGII